MMTPQQNADLELNHIQLEMRAGRYKHIRHFVDPYYCYSNGLVRKSGNISTDDVLWKEHVSVEARLLEDEIGDYSLLRKRVRKEHVMPLRFITARLKEIAKNDDFAIGEIKECLDKYLIFATITKDEDSRLTQMGLNSQMPDGYYDSSSDIYLNKFARYIKAEIKLSNPIQI